MRIGSTLVNAHKVKLLLADKKKELWNFVSNIKIKKWDTHT